MGSAQSEVFVVSPYFVPGEIGMRVTEQNSRRGVHLRLLTNSLAATDEPAVHAGYMAYRKEMVSIGAEVYELSPSLAREQARLGRFGESTGALHAKVIVIDSLNGYLHAMGEERNVNLQLHEMLSYLNQQGVITLLVVSPHGLVGQMAIGLFDG